MRRIHTLISILYRNWLKNFWLKMRMKVNQKFSIQKWKVITIVISLKLRRTKIDKVCIWSYMPNWMYIKYTLWPFWILSCYLENLIFFNAWKVHFISSCKLINRCSWKVTRSVWKSYGNFEKSSYHTPDSSWASTQFFCFSLWDQTRPKESVWTC